MTYEEIILPAGTSNRAKRAYLNELIQQGHPHFGGAVGLVHCHNHFESQEQASNWLRDTVEPTARAVTVDYPGGSLIGYHKPEKSHDH